MLRLVTVVTSWFGGLWTVIKVLEDVVTEVEVEVEALFVVVAVMLVTGGCFVGNVLSTSRILLPAWLSGVAQVAFGP